MSAGLGTYADVLDLSPAQILSVGRRIMDRRATRGGSATPFKGTLAEFDALFAGP